MKKYFLIVKSLNYFVVQNFLGYHFSVMYKKLNKVIGTRGQGVRVWSPRELTTEHLTEPSLRLD